MKKRLRRKRQKPSFSWRRSREHDVGGIKLLKEAGNVEVIATYQQETYQDDKGKEGLEIKPVLLEPYKVGDEGTYEAVGNKRIKRGSR